MKHALFIFLGLVPLMLMPQAQAQDMPSASELQMPASALASTASVATAQSDASSGQADTSTGMPNDPCPNLRGASANAPDDLSKVQLDIDRFTLCVQRAQLLERLNDSAMRSVQDTDRALGLGTPGAGALAAGMPPLPADALAGASVEPLPTASGAAVATTPAATATPAPSRNWTIREIYGSSVDMEARLLSPDGDEFKVKKGTRLPDSSVVTSVTPGGVSIDSGKGSKSLEWTKS